MSFRLVPKSVTLNDIEQRNNGLMAVTVHYFAEFGSLQAHYVKVVEVYTDTFCRGNVAQRI